MIKIIFCTAIVLATTYGWRPSKRYSATLSPKQMESAKHLKEIVHKLSSDIGLRDYQHYANLEMSAQYIIEQFQGLGYRVDLMSYAIGERTFTNIIAQQSKEDPSKEIVIIGAHYDSCFNPGADDNASGIAGMLELARLLKNTTLHHQFKFIAFVNEEPPFFTTDKMGSRVYTKMAKSQKHNIKTAVILEMLGYYSQKPFSQKYLPLLGPFYPNRANFLAIVGNFHSRSIVKNIYTGFKESSDFPVERLIAPGFTPGIYFSDHWSFWKEGFPAVMVTDTAFLRNKHYHKKTDVIETLDFAKMTKAVFGLKDAIIKLDKDLLQ